MTRGKIFFLLFLSTFFLNYCRNPETSSEIIEGKITYDITYLQNDLHNIETKLLPKEMILKFNENYSLTQIDGFMGLFSISLISDFQTSKDITLVKFFDNKYVHYCDKNEVSSIFEYMNIQKINTSIDSNQVFAGLPARAAEVHETGKEPYIIYFTDKLGVSNPNRNNPFQSINGVLLEFQLQLLQIRMNLSAKKIENVVIPDKEFTISDDYKTISRESMILILNKMLETD